MLNPVSPQPPHPELLALGEGMLELCGAEPLSTLPSQLRLFSGGDTLNALVSAARLGSRTGFITRVGDDAFAPGLLASWRALGLDLRHAALVPGFNGLYFISQLPQGERDFSYRRAGSAAAGLTPADLDASYIAGARGLLLSGITQALSPSAQATTLQAAKLARQAGLLVAYDPNYRPALWAARCAASPQQPAGGGQALARAALLELLPWVDWLLPSDPADAGLLAGVEVRAAMAWKCAEQGARLVYNGAVECIPATPVQQVLDSTGAGDAWNGAFLHALLRGADAVAAAQLANAVAARSLGHRGALPLTTS